MPFYLSLAAKKRRDGEAGRPRKSRYNHTVEDTTEDCSSDYLPTRESKLRPPVGGAPNSRILATEVELLNLGEVGNIPSHSPHPSNITYGRTKKNSGNLVINSNDKIVSKQTVNSNSRTNEPASIGVRDNDIICLEVNKGERNEDGGRHDSERLTKRKGNGKGQRNSKITKECRVNTLAGIGPTVRIKLKVDGEEAGALVDTGANLSLISQHLVVGDPVLLPFTYQIKVLGGGAPRQLESDLYVNQYVQLENGRRIKLKFQIVEDLGLDDVAIILGTDNLLKLKANVDFSKGTQPRVQVGGDQIPTYPSPDGTHVCIGQVDREANHISILRCQSDVWLPARSETLVPMKVVNNKINGPVLVYPNESTKEFLGPETLAKAHCGKVQVPVINISHQDWYFKRNKIVGHVATGVTTYNFTPTTPATDTEERRKKLSEFITKLAPKDHAKAIHSLVDKFPGVVALEGEAPGECGHLPFNIDTGGHCPLARRPYRVPVSQRKQVEAQLERLLSQNIIRVSSSPWHSPMVLVKKKDGDIRICIDFRSLNSISKGDSYPLPPIDDLLLDLRESKYFSTLDLLQGYYQVVMGEASKEKTAFSFDNTLYEFNRMPFGLKNAPSHFSRLMKSVLSGLIGTAVIFYLDDLIVLGRTPEEHLENLVKVFSCLERHHLKLRLDKCTFFQNKVEFLGHEVSSEGIRPLVGKVDAIKGYPRPKNYREVKRFLGMASYYRKFIPNFSKISKPLDRIREGVALNWTEEHEKAFQDLKEALMSDQLLAYPDYAKSFIITCDASQWAIGGVIAQEDDSGAERPIVFSSRALTPPETRYSVYEKEGLAIKFMLTKHRFMLLGHKIVIRTDHQPLTHLARTKKSTNHRITRWLLELADFGLENIQYITGKSNRVADALSRGVDLEQVERKEALVAVSTRSMTQVGPPNPVDGEPEVTWCQDLPLESQTIESGDLWTPAGLQKEQREDAYWGPLICYLEQKQEERGPLPPKYARDINQYVIFNGILYKHYVLPSQRLQEVVVIPTSLINRAIERCHCNQNAGHMGVTATVQRIKRLFYFRNVYQKVKSFIKLCHLCNCTKPHRLITPRAGVWPVVKEKGERVHIDLVGPLPNSAGYKYILTIVDAYSRFTWAYALEDKSAPAVAAGLNRFFNDFDHPRVIISDNGLEFTNSYLARMLKQLDVTHQPVSAYHPAANGLVESKNKLVVQILRSLCFDNPGSWASMLGKAVHALNTAYNRSLGDSPYFVLYNQDPRELPQSFQGGKRPPLYNHDDFVAYYNEINLRTFEHVQSMLKRATKEHELTYNCRYRTKAVGTPPGTRVYIKSMQAPKLAPKFTGPHRVLKDMEGKVEIKSITTGKKYKVHKKYVHVVPEREMDENAHKNVQSTYPEVHREEEEMLQGNTENEEVEEKEGENNDCIEERFAKERDDDRTEECDD